jgi:hypothetical protein
MPDLPAPTAAPVAPAPPAPPAAPVAAPAPPAPVAAPAPLAPPAQPPAAAAPPVAPARPGKTLADLLGEKEPDEAQKRLARAGRKALSAFGIDLGKNDDVEKAAEDFKAKRARAKEERKDLETKAQRAADYEASVKAWVDTELPKLSAAERAMIESRGAKDPLSQMRELQYLHGLRASGVLAQPAPAAPTAPAAPAPPAPPPPLAAPANSAPSVPGPAPTNAAPTDHKAIYESLKTRAEQGDRAAYVQANIYLAEHARSILPNFSK